MSLPLSFFTSVLPVLDPQLTNPSAKKVMASRQVDFEPEIARSASQTAEPTEFEFDLNVRENSPAVVKDATLILDHLQEIFPGGDVECESFEVQERKRSRRLPLKGTPHPLKVSAEQSAGFSGVEQKKIKNKKKFSVF